MMNAPSQHSTTVAQAAVTFHGVRYQVRDVARSVEFFSKLRRRKIYPDPTEPPAPPNPGPTVPQT